MKNIVAKVSNWHGAMTFCQITIYKVTHGLALIDCCATVKVLLL